MTGTDALQEGIANRRPARSRTYFVFVPCVSLICPSAAQPPTETPVGPEALCPTLTRGLPLSRPSQHLPFCWQADDRARTLPRASAHPLALGVFYAFGLGMYVIRNTLRMRETNKPVVPAGRGLQRCMGQRVGQFRARFRRRNTHVLFRPRFFRQTVCPTGNSTWSVNDPSPSGLPARVCLRSWPMSLQPDPRNRLRLDYVCSHPGVDCERVFWDLSEHPERAGSTAAPTSLCK